MIHLLSFVFCLLSFVVVGDEYIVLRIPKSNHSSLPSRHVMWLSGGHGVKAECFTTAEYGLGDFACMA